jgi:hypothetical protein
VDDIVGGFFRGFGSARHMISDVVFHELGHQAVDGAASGGQALEGFGARIMFIKSAQDAFELPDDFLRAIDEVQLFSRGV